MTECIICLLGELSGDGKRLPYSKLSGLGNSACGWPDGVPGLRHPSSYGRRQLQSVIDNKHKMKFIVRDVRCYRSIE